MPRNFSCTVAPLCLHDIPVKAGSVRYLFAISESLKRGTRELASRGVGYAGPRGTPIGNVNSTAGRESRKGTMVGCGLEASESERETGGCNYRRQVLYN